ncbi:hypothetical protein BIV23_34840 [Streptomyces monashensis]|uniref:Carrier domain-containing protein n=1 Tax=Streptomyces monashensis TaxID=1678012 RepID=A0A1S2PP49_9ACTN|nr:hypothetical protein BIV23_34840 [Streptomyces monashensis]
MYETIKVFFAGQLAIPEEELTPDAHLTDIGIDSLALVELALVLEADYGIPVDDDGLKAARTLSELAAVAQKLTARQPVEAATAGINAG